MEDPNRLCQEDTLIASENASAPSSATTIENNDLNLDACLIEDPVQFLEDELIHAVPKDPVLETIFRHVDSHVPRNCVAAYLKINYIKLAAVHALKETDQQEADLVLTLQALEVDTTKCIIYARDGPAQKAHKACRALKQKGNNLPKLSAVKLTKFIRDSGTKIPKVYHHKNLDDLCAVWYAINSDYHYSCSKSLDPCRSHEFRVLVITHLHLIGGSPSHHQELKKPKHTSYQQYLALLPDFLSMARCKQIGRLGFSTKAPTDGPWLFQHASSLEALDSDRWTELSDKRSEILRCGSSQAVFLIHVSLDTPNLIAAGSSFICYRNAQVVQETESVH